jgi:hypothetical protein
MFAVMPWTQQTYDGLYDVFRQQIRNGALTYRGNVVWHFPEVSDGREEVFWHLTSREDKTTGDRLPDLRRCERITWVRPLVHACPHADVLDWDYVEGDGTTKTYLWLPDDDFLVILKKYPDGRRRLVTSFWVEYEHKRRELRKKYDNRAP